MPDIDPNRMLAFASAEAFDAWLAVHHATESELWLRIYKKASGEPTVTWEEAVVEALCWGWIDGLKKSLDAVSYVQRFTPRRPRSVWSKINREHCERLIASGRMRAPGLAHVEAARADGRWDAAYASGKEMTIPEDFLRALDGLPAARATFDGLNRTNLFAIGHRLQTARTPATLAARTARILEMLGRGEVFHPPRGKGTPDVDR